MSYTYEEKIANGLQVTNRSNSKPVGAHLQGIEIKDINQGRSGLPVIGRNPRYEIVDLSIGNSGSLTNRPWFEDIGTNFDAGLGQDLALGTGDTSTVISSVFVSGSEVEGAQTTGYNNAMKNLMKETGTTLVYNSETVSWNPMTADVQFPEGQVGQTINFKIQSSDYGFGKEYYDTVPYYDLTNYDAQAYINENGPTGMFPIVGSFPSYDSALQLNGIIEPLEIRRKILGQSLFLPYERQPGHIAGFPMKDASIEFSFDVRENKQRSQFYEDVTTRGMRPFYTGSMTPAETQSHASSLLEAEYVSDYDQPIYAFVERAQEDLLDYDYGMEQAILSMNPIVDEGPLPNNYIDLATGWDSVSRDRMNSIAFRGLTRR